MLCEKCKKLTSPTLQGIQFTCHKMGFKQRIPAHEVNGLWMPGPTKKDLEDWCAKNCKPVKAKVITPATEKVKMVDSNKNWLKKDKKKD